MVNCKKAQVIFLNPKVQRHSFSLCSNEIWRHAAEAHHDIPELWPGPLQAHEVSDTVG